MQFGEEMRRPGDGVGFARTGRMLNEVFAAGAILEHCGLNVAGDVELMEAGKNDRLDLLLLVPLGDQVTADDFQPAFTRPHLFPKVGGAVTPLRIDRVAGGTVVALVEGQKGGSRPCQLGHHMDFGVAHGEMDQCATRECEQRLGCQPLGLGQAVETVLVDGIANALGEVGLQFDGRHGETVEEEHEIDAVFVVQ